MKLEKYDNESLINFYIENGLEFDERKKYVTISKIFCLYR